jgi:hypothetical protein
MVMLGTDMKVAETPKEGLTDFRTPDAYEEWLESEGVQVYEKFYFPSLAKLELGPWERKGGKGAVTHINNRHMPNDCHVIEIKPGGKSEPEHHMYELTIYVTMRSKSRPSSGTPGASSPSRSTPPTRTSTAAVRSLPATLP